MKNYSGSAGSVGHMRAADVIKLIMAFAVVAIHVRAVYGDAHGYSPAFNWFIELAVPYFFIVSGYLIGNKLDRMATVDEKRAALRSRSGKCLRMFVLWLIIYLPIQIYCYAVGDDPLWKDLVRYPLQVLLWGQSAYAFPLWYLWSMVVYLFIYSRCAGMKNARVWIMSVSALIYLGGWTATHVEFDSQLLNTLFRYFKLLTWPVLIGGMYLMCGMLIKRVLDIGVNPPLIVICCVLVSYMLYIVGLPWPPLVGGIALFMLAAHVRLPESPAWMWCRKMSMWIYFVHMWVLFLMIVFVGDALSGIYVRALVVCCACVAVSALIMSLQRMPRFKWLDRLIN